jgi:hypothetical protein
VSTPPPPRMSRITLKAPYSHIHLNFSITHLHYLTYIKQLPGNLTEIKPGKRWKFQLF